ncbi:hypothetical protein GCM10007905_22290 [Mixta theicola]|nr:hypothetical protein GCM10007905_22290 [Mixta theicola]
MNLHKQVVSAIFKELFEDNSMRYKKFLKKSINNDADVYAKAKNVLA